MAYTNRPHFSTAQSKIAEARALSVRERLYSFLLRSLPIKHGKHRLLDLTWPASKHGTRDLVRVHFHGANLCVDIGDLVGWHFAMLKTFDPEVAEVLIRAATGGPEDVFWDIGANKGACSYMMATSLADVKIVAIEPQKGLAADLVHNLEQVARGRYEHYKVGISNEEGHAELVIPAANSGGATLHAQKFATSSTTETVHLVPAEVLARQSRFGWPTLVKIDVEGHEPSVIASLEPALSSQRCRVVVFENHAREREAFESIAAIAERHDYTLFAITKSPTATHLTVVEHQLLGASDYAIISPQCLRDCDKISALCDKSWIHPRGESVSFGQSKLRSI